MRARITAYAGYQLRDYFAGRAVLLILVMVAVTTTYVMLGGLTLAMFDPSAGIEARTELQRRFEHLLAAFSFVAAAIAAQGLVARDRQRGDVMLLFSRPVTPLRYYFQGFVLSGLGGVLLGAAAAQVYAVAAYPVSLPGVAAYIALAWLAIGGLAFLLSTLTRFHVLLFVALLGADFALDRLVKSLRAAGDGNAFAELSQYLLPPGHVILELREAFARGVMPDPQLLAWPLAFGIACLAAALVLLSRRPFGK